MKECAKETFLAYLRKNGLRLGREREEILDAALDIESHFTVQDISSRLAERGLQIHRATIYRNIPVLIESGIIGSLLVYKPGSQHVQVAYEHTFGHKHHDHLVCAKCQKILEIHHPPLEREQTKLCAKYKFTPIRHRLVVEGYCSSCRES